MSFKDIIDELDERLERYEDNMDQDDVPPWIGSNHSEDTGTDVLQSDSVSVKENSDVLHLYVETSGVSRNNIDVNLRNGDETLLIDVGESEVRDPQSYQYDVSDDQYLTSTISADYNNGLLKLTVEKSN